MNMLLCYVILKAFRRRRCSTITRRCPGCYYQTSTYLCYSFTASIQASVWPTSGTAPTPIPRLRRNTKASLRRPARRQRQTDVAASCSAATRRQQPATVSSSDTRSVTTPSRSAGGRFVFAGTPPLFLSFFLTEVDRPPLM